MTQQLIVRKPNNMMEASYELSLPEMRVLLFCIAQPDFETRLNDREMFYVPPQEYAKLFNRHPKSASSEVKKAVVQLWDRKLRITPPEEEPVWARWVQTLGISKTGPNKIKFSEDIRPYLMDIKERGNFTQYKLGNIGRLRTFHSIRLYELLAQRKGLHRRRITLADFRYMLGLTDRYTRPCDLKKDVITPAVKDINAHTDIRVTFEAWKEGRQVMGYHFEIKPAPTPAKKDKPTHVNYLTPAQLYKEAQKKAYMGLTSQQVFDKARAKGFEFDEKAFRAKYP